MVFLIMNVVGDGHDLDRYFHESAEYIDFLDRLRVKTREVASSGRPIVYSPRRSGMAEFVVNMLHTKPKDYFTRYEALSKRFPFLEGLSDTPMLVVPRGSGSSSCIYLNDVKEQLNGDIKVSVTGIYPSIDLETTLLSDLRALKDGLNAEIDRDHFREIDICESRTKIYVGGMPVYVEG